MAKEDYEGKRFYKITKDETGQRQVSGPFDNIYYIEPTDRDSEGFRLSPQLDSVRDPFVFAQVVDGVPVQVFKEEEILVIKGN